MYTRINRKKALSALLVLALAAGLFAAVPLTANADDAAKLADKINKNDHGGSGTLTASVSGDTITVGGKVTGAVNPLSYTLNPGVTIVWAADYSGAVPSIMLSLGGEGAFELPAGGAITNTGPGAAINTGKTAIKLSGGTIRSERFGITTGTSGTVIDMSGGSIETVSPAIQAQKTKINISGGTVASSGTGSTITNIGDGALLTISGGTVKNTDEGVTISSGLDGSLVTISGGTVEGTGASQTVSVKDFAMTGGKIKNAGGKTTIIVSGDCKISGGTVNGADGYAVGTTGVNYSINISGGFVFSYGTSIARLKGDYSGAENHVIDGFSNAPAIGGNAVVCAWNKAAGRASYNEGAADDLTAAPSGASAVWGIEGGKSGIKYANGSNAGFYALSGVTVVPAGQAPAPGQPAATPTPAPTPAPTPTPAAAATPSPAPAAQQTPTPAPAPAATSNNAWGKANAWAVPELQKAAELGLIPETLNGKDFTLPITRAEFAAVSVKVYESLSGEAAAPANPNPFTDTRDIEVLKAYNVGVTAGTSATTFEPDLLLNREQAATMLARVYKRVAFDGWTLAADAEFPLHYTRQAPFADDASISGWARDSVYFMVSKNIINGLGNNLFGPRNTTSAEEAANYASATREQALLISVRMVQNLGAK